MYALHHQAPMLMRVIADVLEFVREGSSTRAQIDQVRLA